MSFSIKKMRAVLGRFWLRFSAFWLEQLVLVEEFFPKDKVEHGTEFFFTTRRTVLKKAPSKPQGCFLVRILNSNVNKDCFSQAIIIKKPLSFHT